MWNALNRIASAANADHPITRRRYERRLDDVCIVKMAGQSYPVSDWSYGGLKIDADGRAFQVGHIFDVTLSVKTQNRIWDIVHSATVVRRNDNNIALQFDPLPGHVRTQMEAVQRQIRLSSLND